MKKFAILCALVALSGCHCNGPAEGEKIGQIVKIETSGIVCPTYEAELIRGGMSDGTGSAGGQSFHFTIPSALVAEATKIMESGSEVRLMYSRPIISSLCKTKTGTFATTIKPLASK